METLLILAFGIILGGWYFRDKPMTEDQCMGLFQLWFLVGLVWLAFLIIRYLLMCRSNRHATHTD